MTSLIQKAQETLSLLEATPNARVKLVDDTKAAYDTATQAYAAAYATTNHTDAPAVTVNNIKNSILIILYLASTKYTKWHYYNNVLRCHFIFFSNNKHYKTRYYSAPRMTSPQRRLITVVTTTTGGSDVIRCGDTTVWCFPVISAVGDITFARY